MSWNYRVFKDPTQDGIEWFSLREVYYNDDDTPRGYTEDAIAPVGEDLKALETTLMQMLRALKLPVLSDADFRGLED